MDRSPDRSSVQVAGEALTTEGVAATTKDMMGLEVDLGGGSRSISLAKRDC